MGVWPYNSLRTYWGGREQFGFKAGRRSPRGEGEFVFTTTEGERIYQVLAEIIRKSKGHEERPPAPLPTAHSDAHKLNSNEDPLHERYQEPPPLPTKPPDLLKRTSMDLSPPHDLTSVDPSSDTMFSETSPAYSLSRAAHQAALLDKKRASLSSSEVPQLPPRVPTQPNITAVSSPTSPSGGGGGRPPPHLSPTKSPLKHTSSVPVGMGYSDDTYSHATHELTKQFPRNASLKVIPGGKGIDYHGLVRSENRRNSSGSSSSSSNSRNARQQQSAAAGGAESESGDITYDLAYPPPPSSLQLMPVPEGEYSSMGDPEEQKKMLMEKKGLLLAGTDISFSAQLREEGTDGGRAGGRGGRGGGMLKHHTERLGQESLIGRQSSDDGLTANPLYGSTENILSVTDMSTSSGGGGGADFHMQDQQQGMQNLTPENDGLVTNPVYGEHKFSSTGVISVSVVGEGEHLPVLAVARPVSPLEDSLSTNPMYSGHESLGITREGAIRADESPESDRHSSCHRSVSPQENSSPAKAPPSNVQKDHETVPDSKETNKSDNGDSSLADGTAHRREQHEAEGTKSKLEGQHPPISSSAGVEEEGDPPRLVQAEDVDSATATTSTQPTGSSSTKNAKGYSKVDKTRKPSPDQEEEEEAEDESPPPPIPPRKYSDV